MDKANLRALYDRPYFLVIMAALFWAGNAVAGKMAVGHISPFVLTCGRWFVALILIAPISIKHLKKDAAQIKKHLMFLLLMGVIGFACFNNLMYLALNSTSAINVVILQSSLPLHVFILNLVLYQIEVSKLQLLGFVLASLGVLIVASQGDLRALLALEFKFGDVLMVIAMFAYGIYTVLLNSKPKIHWLSTMTVLSAAAFVASLPLVGYEIAVGRAYVPDITGLSTVLYTAIFASLLAQAFWIRSIELVGSNTTSMFIHLVPILGIILATLLLGERFGLFHAIAILLVIGGVSISSRGAKQIKHRTP